MIYSETLYTTDLAGKGNWAVTSNKFLGCYLSYNLKASYKLLLIQGKNGGLWPVDRNGFFQSETSLNDIESIRRWVVSNEME